MEVKHFFTSIEEELHLVDAEVRRQTAQIIPKASPKDRPYIEEVINHLFQVPGKKLRPAMLLLSSKIGDPGNASQKQTGPTPHAIIQMAVAVELLHSASLVHDDVIDEAAERRSRPYQSAPPRSKNPVVVRQENMHRDSLTSCTHY